MQPLPRMTSVARRYCEHAITLIGVLRDWLGVNHEVEHVSASAASMDSHLCGSAGKHVTPSSVRLGTMTDNLRHHK
jgi:hypothetical protein